MGVSEMKDATIQFFPGDQLPISIIVRIGQFSELTIDGAGFNPDDSFFYKTFDKQEFEKTLPNYFRGHLWFVDSESDDLISYLGIPHSDCADCQSCQATGKYTGLLAVELCQECKGAGRVAGLNNDQYVRVLPPIPREVIA